MLASMRLLSLSRPSHARGFEGGEPAGPGVRSDDFLLCARLPLRGAPFPLHYVQGREKRFVNLAKQDPGRARQNS